MSLRNLVIIGRLDTRNVLGIALIVCIALCGNVWSQSIYFIYGQPGWTFHDRSPYSTIVYRWDGQQGELDSVWSLGPGVQSCNISVHQSGKTVVISEGLLPSTRLQVLSTENPTESQLVSVDDTVMILRYRVVAHSTGEISLDLFYKENLMDRGQQSKVKRAVLSHSCAEANADRSTESEEIRLAGPRATYGGGKSDIMGVGQIEPGVAITPWGMTVPLDGSPLPVGVAQTSSLKGWLLFANEPEYRVIYSVPDSREVTSSELLIHNRIRDSWASVIIEGAETAPRIVGDRLAGVVALSHPNRDHEPPLLQDRVVVVDPLEGHTFTVTLGQQCEVLWIENDTAYYRVRDKLYRARIENDDFVDRTLLLTDPRVEHIHWAFRGTP